MQYTCKLKGGVFFSLAVLFLCGLFFSGKVSAQSEYGSLKLQGLKSLPSAYSDLHWPDLPAVTKEIHIRSVEQFNIAASQPGTKIRVQRSLSGENVISASDIDIIVEKGVHIDALHINSGVKRIRISGGSFNELVIKAPVSFWPQYKVYPDFIVEDVVIENVDVRSAAYYAFFGMARRLAVLNSKFLSDSSSFTSESLEGIKSEHYIIAGNEFRSHGPLPNISISGADGVIFVDNIFISNNDFNRVNFQIDEQSEYAYIGRNTFVGTGISLSSERSFLENNVFYHNRGTLFDSQILEGGLTIVENIVYSDLADCLVCDAYLTNWTVSDNSIRYYQRPAIGTNISFEQNGTFDQTSPPLLKAPDGLSVRSVSLIGEQNEMRPFFIGNTLLNEWIPKLVDDIADSLGKKNYYRSEETYLTGIGASLSWYYNHPYDGQGADPLIELIQPDKYNALVLTDTIPVINFKEETKEYAYRFYRTASKGNPEIDLFLSATWVHKDRPQFSDWSAAVDRETAVWEQIRDYLASKTGRNNIYIIPGGLALKRLVIEADAGRVPGLDSGDGLFEDDLIHLNELGNYFISLVHFATLYRMNPMGAVHFAYNPKGEEGQPFPGSAMTEKMQEIAWDVVSKYPLAGVAVSTPESSYSGGQAHGKKDRDEGSPDDGEDSSSRFKMEPERVGDQDPPGCNAEGELKDGNDGGKLKEGDKHASNNSIEYGTPPSARVGINLSWNYNHIQQWMFVDAMKYAAPWKTRSTNVWGEWDTQMASQIRWRDDGYPVTVPYETGQGPQTVFTILLYNHELAESTWPAGEYSVFYDGQGELAFGGDATLVSQIPGYCRISVVPRTYVELQITRSLREDPVRNIRVIMPGFEETYTTDPFHPLFLERLGGLAALKFTQPAVTDFHPNGLWERRVTPDYFSQGTQKGVALEYMVRLANLTHKDPWFNLPHGADDAYVRHFAEYLRDHLDESLVAYIEYSNELWNEAYGQSLWIRKKGCRDLEMGVLGSAGAVGRVGKCDDSVAGIRAIAKRMVEVFGIFDDVFMGQSYRILKVLGGSFERGEYNDRLWDLFNDPDLNPARVAADAFAIAPFFGRIHDLGDIAGNEEGRELAIKDILEFAARDLQKNVKRQLRLYSDWAGLRNLRLLAYDAGNHLTFTSGGAELAQKVESASRHPRMGELYLEYFDLWKEAGGDLMMLSNYVGLPVPGATMGVLEYQDQPYEDAYMYQAVMLAAGGDKVMAVCGDGITQAWEGCDDGNRSNGDGCSHYCMIE